MEVLASEAVTRLELVEARGETLVGACHRRVRLLFFAGTVPAVARLAEPLLHPVFRIRPFLFRETAFDAEFVNLLVGTST